MKTEDYKVIRELLVGAENNARSASIGQRVNEMRGIIRRLDETQPTGKKAKLMESEVKNEKG